MLILAEEVKISIPGKLVLERTPDEKEIIKENTFRYMLILDKDINYIKLNGSKCMLIRLCELEYF